MIQDDDFQDGTFPHLEVPYLRAPGMDVQLTEISQGGGKQISQKRQVLLSP